MWAVVYGQTCPPVTSPVASSIGPTSARTSWTAAAGSILYQYTLYKMPSRTFVTSGSGTATFKDWVGLSAVTTYRAVITNICISGTPTNASAPDSVSFTTLSDGVNYTPLGNTKTPYFKVDSNLLILCGDTAIGRAPNVMGQIKMRCADSLFYYYNGRRWQTLSIDSLGIIARLNDKVDSVTVVGQLLYYWKQGVGFGQTLPATGRFGIEDDNSTVDRYTNFKQHGFVIDSTSYFFINAQDPAGGLGNFSQLAVGTTSVSGNATNATNNFNFTLDAVNEQVIISAHDNFMGGTHFSDMLFKIDSIILKPSLGGLYIDSLNTSADSQDSMMVWTGGTGLGKVGRRAIPTGGSTDTALIRTIVHDSLTANKIVFTNADNIHDTLAVDIASDTIGIKTLTAGDGIINTPYPTSVSQRVDSLKYTTRLQAKHLIDSLAAVNAARTFQQVLTAGSTLTTGNQVDLGANYMIWQNYVAGKKYAYKYQKDSASTHSIRNSSGADLVGYTLDGSDTSFNFIGLKNTAAQDRLLGQVSTGSNRAGYITIGSGLSLAAGVLSATVTPSSTTTLTNKRWTPRVGSTTSSATPTINTDNVDVYKLTAQAAAITSFTSNLSGAPADGDILEIQITDDGTARAITWGASFVSSTVTLPTTTVISTTLTVVFQYYTTSSYGNNKWVCVNSF